jgi:hypothetical protein
LYCIFKPVPLEFWFYSLFSWDFGFFVGCSVGIWVLQFTLGWIFALLYLLFPFLAKIYIYLCILWLGFVFFEPRVLFFDSRTQNFHIFETKIPYFARFYNKNSIFRRIFIKNFLNFAFSHQKIPLFHSFHTKKFPYSTLLYQKTLIFAYLYTTLISNLIKLKSHKNSCHYFSFSLFMSRLPIISLQGFLFDA